MPTCDATPDAPERPAPPGNVFPIEEWDGRAPAPAPTLYRWRWRKRLPERHGQVFSVLARGKLNAALIRFEGDGAIVVTSRNALRRA